ncbi:MAG: PAC2 family protein [Dermabacter sp.]|nr:PAC2 family protein [Dermabacter sp.]
MLDPTTLFTYERDVDSRNVSASTLLVTLDAFADSGNVQKHLNAHLSAMGTSRLVGSFDADQLIDYTGVRPEVTLDADHFVGYQKPSLDLYEVTTPGGGRFLVLMGPEPNFQWERAASAVRIIVEQLGVTRTIMASSFPTATPHTRPVPITRYAGDPKDLVISSPMPGSMELRSTFTTVLTLRLAEAGHSVVGLGAHVPSYAHDMDYFPAVPALLTAIETAGGPLIPSTEELETHVLETRAMLDTAAADNEQLQQLVTGFEENYTRMDGIINKVSTTDGAPIPGAEQLSDEVEEFLRDLGETDEHDGHAL